MPATGTLTKVKLPADSPGLVALGGTSPAVPVSSIQAGARRAEPRRDGAAERARADPRLMHHQLVDRPVQRLRPEPREFQAELLKLWKDGYVPINASALTNGKIDIPKGKKSVVFTFDDSTNSQFALGPDGNADPDTEVGIMMKFAETHPGFGPAGTFYLNGDAFGLSRSSLRPA